MDRLLTGEDLVRIRRELGTAKQPLSRRKLAEVMCISRTSIENWEKGRYVSDEQKAEAQRMLFLYIQKQSEFCNRLAVMLRCQNGNQ